MADYAEVHVRSMINAAPSPPPPQGLAQLCTYGHFLPRHSMRMSAGNCRFVLLFVTWPIFFNVEFSHNPSISYVTQPIYSLRADECGVIWQLTSDVIMRKETEEDNES